MYSKRSKGARDRGPNCIRDWGLGAFYPKAGGFLMHFALGVLAFLVSVVLAHGLGFRACRYSMIHSPFICSFCAFPTIGPKHLSPCPRCKSLDHELTPPDWSFPDPEES